MIERIIEFSVRHHWLLIASGVLLAMGGVLAVRAAPMDAIPDLSETQVIVYTEWPDHRPDEVQRAITLPVSRALGGLAGLRTIRGSSDENFSLIHLIFDDSVPLSVARQSIGERLTQSQSLLPPGVVSRLAPDAPATGQIFWYTVEGEGHDLAELRTVQDRLIQGRLAAVPGVAEVASVGGFQSEIQIRLRPVDMTAVGLGVNDVIRQLRTKQHESISTEHLSQMKVRTPDNHSVSIAEIADVRRGVAPRHGMFEKDGNEVVGGVALMLHTANPLIVIQGLRETIDEIGPTLPPGVRIVTAYDRTPLIRGATNTVATALFEAMLTAGICVIIVTRHLRASLVIVLTLPLAVLSAFVALWLLRWTNRADIPINMMSLAGITISIGVLVDSSIVMAENVMHRLHDQFGEHPVRGDVSGIVISACRSVGRPIFFSVMIMLLSFLPVFALEGLEGKMFRPLAITKSLALAGAAVLAITLVPALCVVLVRGRMIPERRSWFVRSLIDVYQPMLRFSLERPLPLFLVLAVTLLAGTAPLGDRRFYLPVVALALSGVWLAAKANWSRWLAFAMTALVAMMLERGMTPLEREFLTPLDEGTAMDMPITIPGISAGQAIDDLKARNMVLCRYPEVEMVMGKVGRADTATDPAPLDMIETMISFRPREFWPRRKLADSDARRDLDWIAKELVQRGVCVAPKDEAQRALNLENAAVAVLDPFHRAIREYAYFRNQECIRETATACFRKLAQEVASTFDVPAAVQASLTVPAPLIERFADDWPGDMVPELGRAIVSTSLKVYDRDYGSEFSPAKIAHWRRTVTTERRRVWQRHIRQLDSELRQRSASTFVFLAMRHLLSESEVQDAQLRVEVRRLRDFQYAPVRVGRRSHHGIVEPAPPDIDPTPKFDALVADLAQQLAGRMVLHPSTRAEIAGFGGEMDAAVAMPGWTNVWTMPIQNRVDMLATGVNTTVGIRVLGPDLDSAVSVSEQIAEVIRQVPGATGVVADPVRGKREIVVEWDRRRASQFGVHPDDVRATIDAALGGVVAVEPTTGDERQTVRVQFDSDWVGDVERISRLPLIANSTSQPSLVSLGQFAHVTNQDRPASIKSENGKPRNYVRLNVHGRDEAEFVREAQQVVAQHVPLPPGVTLEWTGEFEQRLRAQARLRILLPAVLVVIFGVLWFTYRDLADALLMLLAVPGALAGGVLMQWFLGYKLSVTVVVGYIACLGMATSTGIIMLVYLREAIENAGGLSRLSLDEMKTVVLNGAVFRLRPKLLTEATTILGLAPMLWATGIGAEVIRPMAAPVLGGILVADEVIDLLLPVLFFWVRRHRWERLHAGQKPADVLPAQSSSRKEQIDAFITPIA